MDVLDVVEEILLRCLVKDLLRCKSVCKSWYSLISSPSFAETHRKFMSNKEDINTRRISMNAGEWGYIRWSMSGSSNGLVCIYSEYENRIIVTNPLTREFRELAQPPDHLGPRRLYWRCIGFGYDSSTDDYKVVSATCGCYITFVHILSLKSNIWKFIGQNKYYFRSPDPHTPAAAMPGILFNGALHWFWIDASRYMRDKKALIVSFDLAKEEFTEIPQPDDRRYGWSYRSRLGIIQDRLCIFPEYGIRGILCSGIWVMKSHNSWERLPLGCEMKDHAIHYMLKDTNHLRMKRPPTYFCDENIRLSSSKEHIRSPMFLQTLISPYVKERRDTEGEERGMVTDKYKNGSKEKERLLKPFLKKQKVK